MSNVGGIIAVIFLGIAGMVAYTMFSDDINSVTKAEFQQAVNELKADLDSVKIDLKSVKLTGEKTYSQTVVIENNQYKLYDNMDSVKNEMRNLNLDVDTLKFGQQVIYNQITQKSNKSWVDIFKQY